MDTRTDTSGRQQPATKPPQKPGKEAWRREMREGAAATTETRASTTSPASARLRATIATLHYMVSQAESIDLAAAGQELSSDDLDDARRKVSRCREWIEKVDAALRVGR